MRDVLDAVVADAGMANQRRQEMRSRFPEVAAIKDEIGECCRVRHISVDGVTVAGRLPEKDPDSWVTVSGDFAVFACNFGRGKK